MIMGIGIPCRGVETSCETSCDLRDGGLEQQGTTVSCQTFRVEKSVYSQGGEELRNLGSRDL